MYAIVRRSPAVFVLSLLCWSVTAEPVKQSASGICHSSASPYYEKTRRFTAFDDLSQCLAAGGRLPKGQVLAVSGLPASATDAVVAQVYERAAFGHGWADDDGDCLNTRHELLVKLSTAVATRDGNPCTVTRGRWLDPYTDRVFHEARQLDIDHLVPLKWAWEHGAAQWSPEKREAFANDEANLFAVQASVNREKGARGPLDWLPPNGAFACQYTLRFQRIVKTYGLALSADEGLRFKALRQTHCGRDIAVRGVP